MIFFLWFQLMKWIKLMKNWERQLGIYGRFRLKRWSIFWFHLTMVRFLFFPQYSKHFLQIFLPFSEVNEMKITVGKIYAGLQILECWRATRFKKTDNGNPPVSTHQRYSKFYHYSAIFNHRNRNLPTSILQSNVVELFFFQNVTNIYLQISVSFCLSMF